MGNEKKKKEGPHFGDEADALAGLEFGRGEGLDAHAVAPVHVLVAVGGRPRDYLEAVQVDEDAAADGRRPLVVVLGGAEDREAAKVRIASWKKEKEAEARRKQAAENEAKILELQKVEDDKPAADAEVVDADKKEDEKAE